MNAGGWGSAPLPSTVAAHEAGHALLEALRGGEILLVTVRGDGTGSTLLRDATPAPSWAHCAGFAGERLLRGELSPWSKDQSDVRDLFRAWHRERSIPFGGLPGQEVAVRIEEGATRCEAWMRPHLRTLKALATALDSRGTLTGSEVHRILGIPRPAERLNRARTKTQQRPSTVPAPAPQPSSLALRGGRRGPPRRPPEDFVVPADIQWCRIRGPSGEERTVPAADFHRAAQAMWGPVKVFD